VGERITLAGLACVCLIAVTAGAVAMRTVPRKSAPIPVPNETGVPSR
jgi:hypothetical protein